MPTLRWCTGRQLHHRPRLALAAIEAWLAQQRPSQFGVVGSSLGGFYATWLAERHGARAVLINPAVRPCRDLAGYRGPQHNPYTGEDYTLTDEHVVELAALRVERITRAERYFLLVQTGDEVLDWHEAVAFYAGAYQSVQGGGDHAFADFASQLPAILRFVDA